MFAQFKVYFASLRLGYSLFFVYRGSLILQIFSELILLGALYYLWRAVFDSSPGNTISDISFDRFIAYLIVARGMARIVSGPAFGFFGQSVRDDTLIVDLLQPVYLEWVFFFRRLGQKMGELTVVIPALMLFSAVFDVWDTHSNIVWFLLSAFMGFTCAYFFEMLVSLTAFYTLGQQGIHELKFLVVALLSGSFFPLDILPYSYQIFVEWLPFRHFVYTPVYILTFDQDLNTIVRALLLQMVWICSFAFMVNLGMKYARQHFDISGG